MKSIEDIPLEEQLDHAKRFAFELNIRAVRAEKKIEIYEEIKSKLVDLVEVQGRDGNWNHDHYMRGLYNGMEMALALFEQRAPVFKSPE